jgi:hypothetical protein
MTTILLTNCNFLSYLNLIFVQFHFLLEDEYDSDVSSGHNRERIRISSVISLIYNMNNKCPNNDHCGTSPLMFPTSDRQFCRTTF